MVKKKKNDGDGKSSTLFWLTIFLLVLIILCVVSLNQINDKINKLERSNEQEISQVIPSWEQLAFEAGWYGECVEEETYEDYEVIESYDDLKKICPDYTQAYTFTAEELRDMDYDITSGSFTGMVYDGLTCYPKLFYYNYSYIYITSITFGCYGDEYVECMNQELPFIYKYNVTECVKYALVKNV